MPNDVVDDLLRQARLAMDEWQDLQAHEMDMEAEHVALLRAATAYEAIDILMPQSMGHPNAWNPSFQVRKTTANQVKGSPESVRYLANVEWRRHEQMEEWHEFYPEG